MRKYAKLTTELKLKLEGEGYKEVREIEGRGICAFYTFLYTYALCYGLDETGIAGRWCYDNPLEPLAALHLWDGIGDPPGNWIKHKGYGGEYSNPNNLR